MKLRLLGLALSAGLPAGLGQSPAQLQPAALTSLASVQIWNDRVVHVTHGGGGEARPSLTVVSRPQLPAQPYSRHGMTTPLLDVRLGEGGRVEIFDRAGRRIVGEADTPPGPGVRQSFTLDPDEAIYGLGQQPDGALDRVGRVVHLEQRNGRTAVPVLLSSKGYVLLWDNPAITDVDVGRAARDRVTWASEAGRGVDYYVCFGPSPEEAMRAYRELTGNAPMMAEWTLGFWQCRERYRSQEELLGVVAEYRRRGVPLDGIIQDWQYWVPGTWGSHAFDPSRYPDPKGMVEAVHRAHAHIIISVWPKFDLGQAHTAELEKAGALYAPVYPSVYPKGQNRWYDAFNPRARRIYWRQISESLFRLGIDGWWLDASEPELSGKWGEFRQQMTAAGPAAEVYNAYPLEHTAGLYQGQRAESSAKRVFLLTRSAYAGQQRNSAVTWSGDIQGTWEVLRQQIPAGLNFVASGIPYWNTDTGGFFGGDPADPKYAELFTRWFQFSAFCPMFRVHGTNRPKEIWRWDPATQRVLADFINLRYRLLPYIYSTAHAVTLGGSMMEPLPMAFPGDPSLAVVTDQYLFGPALMACPVTAPGASSRPVDLPRGADWTDFWTGRSFSGGSVITGDAPISRMPIFVRAGSILPYGPAIQYAGEKPGAPVEIRVYPGADGDFSLYEDEGDNYDYERGESSTIAFHWDDTARTLSIAARRGEFPGMVRERKFRIVAVAPGRGAGLGPSDSVDAEIGYDGSAATVRLPSQPFSR
ncbi:MAG TPA: TIM-barrel domain-containing protein [Opitutaceae bacterium]|nr:TIM-barrel domain-containing protein [Opitutaceae bacterium]